MLGALARAHLSSLATPAALPAALRLFSSLGSAQQAGSGRCSPLAQAIPQILNPSASGSDRPWATGTSSSSKTILTPESIPEVFGHIHSTESFSAVDGPGVRFLVFLQGCAMRCLFCSNPDTWDIHGGKKVSSKDIVSQVKKVLPYLKPRGGITCSGGEPMLQPEFVSTLFKEIHALGLNTCIDTTGQGTKHHNWDVVLPHTDLVLWCIKHIDPVKYEALTGLKQKGAMKFAHELAERQIPYWIRYVYIPGFTDDSEDVDKLIKFVKEQPTCKGIELLPYHLLGRNKWEVLKLQYPLEGVEPPKKKKVLEVMKLFKDAGINVACNI